MLGIPVQHIRYQSKSLQGGTLGDVQLLVGEASTQSGQQLPFRMVQKTQKQWHRPGDPGSWRREYDLAQSAFADYFPSALHFPTIYHTEITDDETRLWMEEISGISGAQLTLHNLEQAASALARFQGACMEKDDIMHRIVYLGDAEYLRRDFAQWTPDTVEYQWLRSSQCTIPKPLQTMLLDTQAQSDQILQRLHALPQVLCHRDYWTENIFVQNGSIAVIDWDCAGWGYIGEDIASLIADETEASQITAYYQALVPAYYNELRKFMQLPPMDTLPIREMILMKFGYRLVQQVMFAKEPEPKAEAIRILQQINGMRRNAP